MFKTDFLGGPKFACTYPQAQAKSSEHKQQQAASAVDQQRQAFCSHLQVLSILVIQLTLVLPVPRCFTH